MIPRTPAVTIHSNNHPRNILLWNVMDIFPSVFPAVTFTGKNPPSENLQSWIQTYPAHDGCGCVWKCGFMVSHSSQNVRDEFCGPRQIGFSVLSANNSRIFKEVAPCGPILSNKLLLMELNICVCLSLQGHRYLQQETLFDKFGAHWPAIVQFLFSLDECVCCGLFESWGWAWWCGFILNLYF